MVISHAEIDVEPQRVVAPELVDLVRRAQAHDLVAQERLVELHYTLILRFLTGLTGERDVASDLTQETFLRAFSRIEQLRDPAAIRPWLYRIARNEWLSTQRRSRLPRLVSLEWLSERSHLTATSSKHVDAIEQYADNQQVRQIMATLPPTAREVLLLRHVAGCTGRQIAEILDISTVAAQRRLNRAEESFRHAFTTSKATDDA